MGHCETLSVSRIRNSIFRILLSQLPLEGSKWFRHSCPTSSKKSCQQRTVYFHSLSGLLKPFLPRWLMSPHAPGSQATANSSSTCHFFKDYWQSFAENHQVTLTQPYWQANSLEIILFSPDNCTGSQEWRCGISSASECLSGESHHILMLLTVYFSPKHLTFLKINK